MNQVIHSWPHSAVKAMTLSWAATKVTLSMVMMILLAAYRLAILGSCLSWPNPALTLPMQLTSPA